MPEKTKQNKDSKKPEQKEIKESAEEKGKGNWSEDQQKNSYYYDDDYGYEIYNPDEDDED